MKDFIARITVIFVTIMISFMCLFNGTDNAGSSYDAERPDQLLLDAVIISDTHTNDATTHDHNKTLARLFSGIGRSITKLNAVVIPGDLTEGATPREYANLGAIINRYNKAENVIPALGNHDVRGDMGKEDYEANMQNYYAFCQSLGIDTQRPYWSKYVGDYLFIVLGAEAEIKDCTWFSDEQLAWLDQSLATAESSGKPVFIINHQVIDHTNNVDRLWRYYGSIGDQSDVVREIITRHTDRGLPVVFVSGHLHADYSEYSFEEPSDNLYCLNLPSAQYNEEFGQGCTLEVYADRIRIRTRNFITGEWLPDAYTIRLK